MKYIEFPELSHLSRTLTHDSSECTVHTRIEAYSCKSVRNEKRMFKALEHSYAEEAALSQSTSPPAPEMTAFGPMDKHSSRKTLYLLIATLNACFPDRDFSATQPHHFRREESGQHVLNALSTTVAQLRSSQNAAGDVAPRSYSSFLPLSGVDGPSSPLSTSPISSLRPGHNNSGVHPALYKMIDDVIGLTECEVYSFSPDGDDDPHAGDSDSDLDDDDAPFASDDDDDTFLFEADDDPLASPARPGATRSFSGSSAEWSPIGEKRARGPFGGRGRGTAPLWSSHYFFYNPKIKRVLFVTSWARGKSSRPQYTAEPSERFVGWFGASGAGARALATGINVKRTVSLSA